MHNPRLKKSVLFLTLITATLLVLSSCSAVFTANVGGKVRDVDNDEGIADMAIYAYTSTGQRDSDKERYTTGPFYPSSDAGYVARTNSGDDGSFVINKVIWESLFPAFGKTADYKEIALLFYHEDYGLHKNSDAVWITSDSTNVSMVDEKFSKINQTTDIRVNLRDVADETLIDDSFDVRLAVAQKPGDSEGKVTRETIRGTGTIAATYPVAVDEIALDKTTVTAAATLEGSNWMQCDEEGTVIQEDTFTIAGNNSEITLYLKQSLHNFPRISGEIDLSEGDPNKDPDNNDLFVWLGEEKEDGTIELFEEGEVYAITEEKIMGANDTIIRHGTFDDLGTGLNWENSNYSGKYDSKDVFIVVDKDGNRELSVGDYYYKFTIHGNKPVKKLGKLRWHTNLTKSDLKEVEASHIPQGGGK